MSLKQYFHLEMIPFYGRKTPKSNYKLNETRMSETLEDWYGLRTMSLWCDTVELSAIPLFCLPAWWNSVSWVSHFHRSSVPEESRWSVPQTGSVSRRCAGDLVHTLHDIPGHILWKKIFKRPFNFWVETTAKTISQRFCQTFGGKIVAHTTYENYPNYDFLILQWITLKMFF